MVIFNDAMQKHATKGFHLTETLPVKKKNIPPALSGVIFEAALKKRRVNWVVLQKNRWDKDT